jgi:hypothetical protein
MADLHNHDNIAHHVPVRKLRSPFKLILQPVDYLLMGEEKIPVEVSSAIPNGSIVVSIGDIDKKHYIVQTLDIVYAAFRADRDMRKKSKRGEENRRG